MKILLILFFTTFYPIYALNSDTDPLKESYSSISKKIKASDKLPSEQRIYLATYLKKAKKEKDWEHIVKGYRHYLHNSGEDKMIIYADSMVFSALESKNKELIASSYLTKGLTYYWKKDYVNALENYITANDYLSEVPTPREFIKYKLKYNIGLIRYRLEQHKEALKELEACKEYFKDHNERAYLNTLHFIGMCYRSMGDYEQCSKINEKGLQEGHRLGKRKMEVYFNHSEGVNNYLKGDYESAIRLLEKVNPVIDSLGDFANVTTGHFYLGMSYWKLNKPDRAIPYLKLVDKIYTERNFAKREFLPGYNILINHYKSKNDTKNQLFYLDQKVKHFSTEIVVTNELYPLINQRYTQANIKRQQEGDKRNLFLEILLIGGAILLSISLGYRYYIHHYPSPKNLLPETTTDSTKQNDKTTLDRPDKSIQKMKISNRKKHSIKYHLNRFEKNEMFLEKKLTLALLAHKCGTNTKYLSHILNHEKGKSFREYITDLRLSYIIGKIQEQSFYRSVKINFLAKECGFETTQSFTRSFKVRTGEAPSKYIHNLRRKISKET